MSDVVSNLRAPFIVHINLARDSWSGRLLLPKVITLRMTSREELLFLATNHIAADQNGARSQRLLVTRSMPRAEYRSSQSWSFISDTRI